MNLDQFLSTEEDWAQQSWHDNDDQEYSSSPIMFGRFPLKIKDTLSDEEKESCFMDAPVQGDQEEDQELKMFFDIPATPIKKKQIRKNKKVKNQTITNLYKNMISSIMEDAQSQNQIIKQLQHCQKMKTVIDGLEKTLVNIKSLLLHNMQTRSN